jgi:hypothetical protein
VPSHVHQLPSIEQNVAGSPKNYNLVLLMQIIKIGTTPEAIIHLKMLQGANVGLRASLIAYTVGNGSYIQGQVAATTKTASLLVVGTCLKDEQEIFAAAVVCHYCPLEVLSRGGESTSSRSILIFLTCGLPSDPGWPRGAGGRLVS